MTHSTNSVTNHHYKKSVNGAIGTLCRCGSFGKIVSQAAKSLVYILKNDSPTLSSLPFGFLFNSPEIC